MVRIGEHRKKYLPDPQNQETELIFEKLGVGGPSGREPDQPRGTARVAVQDGRK
jgi:hypothetical protein